MKTLRLVAAICLALSNGTANGAEPAPSQSLGDHREERAQDVEFLAEELPKLHIRPFEKVSEAAWRRAAVQLGVETQLLADVDYYLRLCQLVAMLGDSHTRVGKAPGIAFRGYPFAVSMFKEGPCLIAVEKPHAALLGARLVKVGDATFEDAEPRISTLFAAENRSSVINGVCQFVSQAEPLVYLQLIDRPEEAPFTFLDAAGVEHVVRFNPVDGAGPRPEIASLPSVPKEQWPASYTRDRDYRFVTMPEKKAVYVRYDVCRDDPERPFKEFVDSIGKAIEEIGAERIVVDLRFNGGGNSAVMAPLTKLIASKEAFKRKGSVAVLIGRRTFSSAQLNAVELQRECGAVLVGQPTGQKPNAFGEVRTFKLPSSGIEIQYSTKEFRTAPPGTDPESTMPDVEVEPSVRDLEGARDPVLEKALSLPLGD